MVWLTLLKALDMSHRDNSDTRFLSMLHFLLVMTVRAVLVNDVSKTMLVVR